MPVKKSLYIRARIALMVDGNEIYRSAIARVLQKNCGFPDVIEAASIDAGINHLKGDDQIAFLVADLGAFSNPAAASTVESLRGTFPDLVVVVMSESDERADILAALHAGAHGYVLKTMPLAKITAALEAISAGEISIPWTVADLFPKLARSEPKKPVKALAKLTARQADVLRLIRAGRSNRQIASELGLTEGTVKAHANAIFRTLGVTNRSSAAAMDVD